MKILLDECVTHKLKRSLKKYEVYGYGIGVQRFEKWLP